MKIKPAQKNRLSDWKISKLGDVATISRGGSPRPIEFYVTSEEDGLNWLRIGDVVPGAKYIYKTSEKIKKEGLKKTTLVHEGDFILSNSMSFGRPYIMKTSACIHDGWLALMSIKTDLISKDFLYYLLSSNKIQGLFTSISAGSGVQNLKKETVSEVLVKLPPTDEQNRIVSVLETWDKAIEKLSKKIELKKNIKKGLMQRLLTGKLRLPGFSEAWQVVKLGDVCDLYQPKTITSEEIKSDGQFKVYGANGIIGYFDKYNHEESEVLITCRGATCGNINYSEPKSWVTGNAMVAKPKKNLVKDYLYYFLCLSNLNYVITGMAQPQITRKDLAPFKIKIPKSREEQIAIANIFITADKEIEIFEKKLERSKDQKKYLLNNLITGAIRTPEKMPEPSHRDGTHD